jgi:hypothetical protein
LEEDDGYSVVWVRSEPGKGGGQSRKEKLNRWVLRGRAIKRVKAARVGEEPERRPCRARVAEQGEERPEEHRAHLVTSGLEVVPVARKVLAHLAVLKATSLLSSKIKMLPNASTGGKYHTMPRGFLHIVVKL